MKNRISKRSALLAGAVVLAISAAAHAKWSGSRDYAVRHDDVVIGQNETMQGDVVTDKSVTVLGALRGDCIALGGPVAVKGKVDGDLITFGGPVALSGSVTGDLVSIGGNVETSGLIAGNLVGVGVTMTLKPGTTVQGDISSVGGRLDQAPGAIIRGNMTSVTPGMLRRVLPPLLRFSGQKRSGGDALKERLLLGGLLGAGLLAFFSLLLLGALLFVLPAIFFPKNVENVAREMTVNFWKSAGIGALIVMALFPAFLAMLISIMGIPLIPLAALLLVAAKVLGFCGFSLVLARRFFEGIKHPAPASLIGQVCIGYALLAAVLFVGHALPVLGWLLTLTGLIVAAFGVLLGLGAVWSTRMGAAFAPAPVPQPQAPPVQPAQPAAPAAPPPVTPA